MHSNKIAIERAKKFLQKMGCCDFDEENAEDNHNFDRSDKPYFVYSNVQRKGCWVSEQKFYSKSEINELIKHQFHSDYDDKWDHVYILDIKKNKVVKPHL